jgi:DNA modification methylase
MLAFALRADGWYLRQDIIWHKPNPMPESVKDRCTKTHEYLFLLTKSARYWWDAEAMREPAEERTLSSWQDRKALEPIRRGDPGRSGNITTTHTLASKEGRNKRSVWTIASLPTPEAHFATYPIELPEICIRAGCPEGGTVLDPFAGAGTTGLACLKNGRQFVGIELNAEYIRIAEDRARKYYPLLFNDLQPAQEGLP